MDLHAEKQEPKILIAYFSKTGNTRTVAGHIQEATSGAIYEIVPVKPYTKGYLATVFAAKMEQLKKTRPAIATNLASVEPFDIVFIGYPNWWNTMPLIINTFLEYHDFAGKTIVPFATHGGSGLGKSVKDMGKLVPKATILDGIAIKAKEIESSQEIVNEWLKQIGIVR